MSKFNIGDIVVPKKESDSVYGITNTKMVAGEVLQIDSHDNMLVLIKDHKNKSEVGGQHWVRQKYFEVLFKCIGFNIQGLSVETEEENTTIVIDDSLVISLPSSSKLGIASLNDTEDTFCEEIGKALAFYRSQQ